MVENKPGNGPERAKSKLPRSSSPKAGGDIVEVPTGKTTFFDLDYNVAAALCYLPILPIVPSIVWLKTETDLSDYLKFHCVQGLVLGVAFLALSVAVGTVEAVIGVIPVIGGLLGMVLALLRALLAVFFITFCVRQMLAVYKGKPGKIPIVTNLTDQVLGKTDA